MISDVTPYSLQGCAKEDVESLAYTIKEINAVTGLGLYTASVVCFPKTVPLVQEVWMDQGLCQHCQSLHY